MVLKRTMDRGSNPLSSTEIEVRWKQGESWVYGHLAKNGKKYDDKSVLIFQKDSDAARNIMPDRLHVLIKGPRGGKKWIPYQDSLK